MLSQKPHCVMGPLLRPAGLSQGRYRGLCLSSSRLHCGCAQKTQEGEAGEMAQLVKCLPCKHELDSQNLGQNAKFDGAHS